MAQCDDDSALSATEKDELIALIRETAGDATEAFLRAVKGTPQASAPPPPALLAPIRSETLVVERVDDARRVAGAGPRAVRSQAPATPSFVFVMAFTGPHAEEALNVVLSLQRQGVFRGSDPAHLEIYSDLGAEQQRRLKVAAQDRVAFRVLRVAQVDVASSVASWGQFGFSEIVRGKFVALKEVMATYPRSHIVWLDTDLFFFRDPRGPLLNHAARHQQAVAHFQWSLSNACTGFFMICAQGGGPQRAAAKRMLLLAEELLAEHVRKGPKAGYRGDESCINAVISRHRVSVSYLPRGLFPNGKDYFAKGMRASAVLVHNNFIRGLDRKIARFKTHGLWLVGQTPSLRAFRPSLPNVSGMPAEFRRTPSVRSVSHRPAAKVSGSPLVLSKGGVTLSAPEARDFRRLLLLHAAGRGRHLRCARCPIGPPGSARGPSRRLWGQRRR
jgi:hypothetical protein